MTLLLPYRKNVKNSRPCCITSFGSPRYRNVLVVSLSPLSNKATVAPLFSLTALMKKQKNIAKRRTI